MAASGISGPTFFSLGRFFQQIWPRDRCKPTIHKAGGKSLEVFIHNMVHSSMYSGMTIIGITHLAARCSKSPSRNKRPVAMCTSSYGTLSHIEIEAKKCDVKQHFHGSSNLKLRGQHAQNVSRSERTTCNSKFSAERVIILSKGPAK